MREDRMISELVPWKKLLRPKIMTGIKNVPFECKLTIENWMKRISAIATGRPSDFELDPGRHSFPPFLLFENRLVWSGYHLKGSCWHVVWLKMLSDHGSPQKALERKENASHHLVKREIDHCCWRIVWFLKLDPWRRMLCITVSQRFWWAPDSSFKAT